MYVKPMSRTMPGTDTKLTPDSDDPTMPMATTHQGDRRLPRKKASLSVLRRPATSDMSSRMEK